MKLSEGAIVDYSIHNTGKFVPTMRMVHPRILTLDVAHAFSAGANGKSCPEGRPVQIDKLKRHQRDAREHPVDRDCTFKDMHVTQQQVDDPTLVQELQP